MNNPLYPVIVGGHYRFMTDSVTNCPFFFSTLTGTLISADVKLDQIEIELDSSVSLWWIGNYLTFRKSWKIIVPPLPPII